LNAAVKLTSVVFTAGAAVVLIAAPLLFGWLLRGKYDAGLLVLPGTLAYCIWFSLFCVAYNYLLCVEKARFGSAALFLGLLANAVLNYLLAPRYGLPGVVFATATANAFALGAVYLFSRRAGMVWDWRTWLASTLPVTLCLGGWPALAILVIVLATAHSTGWIFDSAEVRQALRAAASLWERLAGIAAKRRPASA
jgi:O-antigen/teichoic acid export membrane protein